MRRVFLALFFCLLLATYLSPVLAIDSTPSASIKSKLEILKAEIASRAASLKSEINQKLQNKAYIGTIKSISENSIGLEGTPSAKQIRITQDTLYDSNTKIKYSYKKAASGDYIAALGDVDETQTLNAKKIVLLPPQSDKKLKIVWGQIYVFGDVMSIKTKDNKNVKVIFDDSTTWQKGDEKITTAKVKLNDFVVVVGLSGSEDKISASFIYIIPTGGYLKPKKIATPAANKK